MALAEIDANQANSGGRCQQHSIGPCISRLEAGIPYNIMWSRDEEALVATGSSSSDESCDDGSEDPENIKDECNTKHAECRHTTAVTSNNGEQSSTSDTNKVKDWLAFYARFTSTAGNQEKLLKLLQWSLWMIGAFLAATTPLDSDVAGWLKKVSCDVCYARYVTRLLGWPVALEGAVTGSWATSSSDRRFDRVYKFLGQVLAYSMVGYYPAEHIAFAMWMKPTESGTVLNWTAETWFYWSMRFWLAYLIAELAQSVLQWYELSSQRAKLLYAKKTDNDGEPLNTSELGYLDTQLFNTVMLLLRDALYLLPCIHWSLPSWDTQPWLPLCIVNSLMWSESVACLYQALKNAT